MANAAYSPFTFNPTPTPLPVLVEAAEGLGLVTSGSAQRLATLAAPPVITRVTVDSRKVGSDRTAYVAVAGSKLDGHTFIPQALQQGARVVVVSQPMDTTSLKDLFEDAVFLETSEPYRLFAFWNSLLFNRPGQTLFNIGVTGTNGKTSVSHLVEQLLNDQHLTCGLVGTLGVRLQKHSSFHADTGLTTPGADVLQQSLGWLVENGATHVSMEASSHALDQERLFDCPFKVAIFTNLTQDHLDYHGTMDAYFEAKAKLFRSLEPGATAVINLDDPWAPQFIKACKSGVDVVTYSLSNPAATLVVTDEVRYSPHGSACTVRYTPTGVTTPLTLKMGGEFSLYNALASILGAVAAGGSITQALASIQQLSGVRGRFERVADTPTVIVDYAHTPDGLENLLQAAQAILPEGSRLITVFGCGGDRDRTKRPKMALIAQQHSHEVWATSDNPRSEDPEQILDDVFAGFDPALPCVLHRQVDRREAIHEALRAARPQDMVVIAGKGHETYQILATGTIDFDDRAVVQAFLASHQPTAASAQ